MTPPSERASADPAVREAIHEHANAWGSRATVGVLDRRTTAATVLYAAIDSLVAAARAEERAPLEKLLLDFAVPYTDKDEPGGLIDTKQWGKACDAMHAIWRWYLARKNASRTSTP